MRTIVIGDIHGCYYELIRLMKKLEKNNAYTPNEDKLIFLGDYIDRGTDSRLVIRYIKKLQNKYENVIALIGNHEDMALDYFEGDGFSPWLYNGYEYTLESYKGFEKALDDDLEWMRNLPLYHEDEHFIYVHAGIDKFYDMDNQIRDTLLWTRDSFIYDTTEYHKRVIFGHTPIYLKPYYTIANDICIDSGCVYGGALTALVIEDNKETGFYNVNKRKEK